MFVGQVTARTAADLAGVNYHTAHLFYHKLRDIITAHLEAEWPFDGEVEIDESYFGGVRKGRFGRGAAGKVPVFGLLKRGGHVYACMIPDASGDTLMPIIRRKVLPDSIVYTDSWKAYNVLDVSEFRHKQVNHSESYVDGQNHINGIENFWNQAKRVLRKYNGIPRKHFHLFLKECEFRFNYGSPKEQLKTLMKWCRLQSLKGRTKCVIYTSPLTIMGKRIYQTAINDFMANARDSFARRGRRISGTRGLSAATRREIQAAVKSYARLKHRLPVTSEIMTGLLERFEEICRRQAIEVAAGMRPAVLRQLVTELQANHQALGHKSAQRLVPVTAFHGAIVAKLKQEFPELSEGVSIITRAALNFPGNPRAYLSKVRRHIEELSNEEEFAAFRDTPGIIRQVAAGYPGDPRACLRRTVKVAAALSQQKEFAAFRDTPGIFRLAAQRCPRDPRGFLRKAARTIRQLAALKEFVAFRDTLGLFRLAAVHHPDDPRGFLRKVARDIKAIMAEKEFAAFHDKPGIIRQAVAGNPGDPRACLRRLARNIAELQVDKEFAAFRDAPGIFRRAAFNHPTDPRAWLRSEPKTEWHVLRVGNRRSEPLPAAVN